MLKFILLLAPDGYVSTKVFVNETKQLQSKLRTCRINKQKNRKEQKNTHYYN